MLTVEINRQFARTVKCVCLLLLAMLPLVADTLVCLLEEPSSSWLLLERPSHTSHRTEISRTCSCCLDSNDRRA